MENKSNLKPSDMKELSNIKVDNDNSEDFLIDICRLMKNNEEYHDIENKPNFGIEELTEERKKVKDADNVYTIKQFVTNNFATVKKDKKLQHEIKIKLERLKNIVLNKTSAEYATLRILELQINDMLNEDIEE